MMVSGGEASGRCLGLEGGALTSGISALRVLFCPTLHMKTVDHVQPEKALSRIQPR